MSDTFDYNGLGDPYSTRADFDDQSAAEHAAQQDHIDTEGRSEVLADARAEYAQSLYPTHFVDSTETSFWEHYTTPTLDPRNQIFIAEAEGTVGISADQYIIAVTEQHGAYASPSTHQDVTATIQQLGLEPNAVAHALERAEQRGYELNPALSEHPAIQAARDLVPVRENVVTDQTPPPPPLPALDLTDPPDTTAQPEIVYGYDSNLETFQATVWSEAGRPQEFGTSPGEHLTVQSLHSAVSGDDTARNIPDDLHQLADQVRSAAGDYTIVGLKDEGDPRLFVVTPNQNVNELTNDGEYSPNGFNWGYDGAGPAQTSKAMVEVAQGATPAESVEHVRAITGVLSPGLPDNFTITGSQLKDVTSSDVGPAFNLSTPTDGAAISAVRAHISAPAPQIDLDAPSPDLGVSL